METTPKEISPEAFAKCLQLLRGPSDEERFTGLLIVSKIIKADDTAKIKQVLDAIGFNFVNRLLTSKPNAEGFSYTSLALSILSTFTSIPEFITTADFITKTPFLLDILETNDDVHTLDDAFQCILAIGSSEQGRTELFNSVHHGIRSLNKGLLKSLSSDHLIQRLEFFQQYVLYVREHIQNFTEISQLGKELATVIPPLCALFKEHQDMLKFHIQSTLLAIITSIKDIPLSDLVRSSNTWSEDLRLGLFSVLTGKVTEQYRDPAIILTSILVDNLGPLWAWGSKGNPGSDGMFAELIVRLARIEIQLILEQPDNFVPKATLLTSSYSILEAAISYLSSGSWNFNPERLENIQKTFSDVFSLILRYLLFCKEKGLKTDPIGLLSIRVLAVWLSEDTSTLRAEIFEALPFILEMHPLENDPTGVYDPFPVMIPALLNLTSEPEPLDMFVKSNGPQKLFQYINANCLTLTQTLIKKDEKAANNAISMLGSCFGICLNLLSISSEFQANSMSDIFTSLVPSMELLSTNVQRDADRLFILANMVTVALCLMRKLDFVKNMRAVYSPIIAYFSLVGTKQEESIADVWLLGLFAFGDCLNKDKEFLDAVANSKLPQIFVDRVLTADIAEDERQQWNAILTILAARSTKARQTLIVHGGLHMAAKYSFTQLEKLLQQN